MSFVINPYRFGTTVTFNPVTDTLSDSVALDAVINEFMYSDGNAPGGARTYLDDIALDTAIINFSYTT